MYLFLFFFRKTSPCIILTDTSVFIPPLLPLLSSNMILPLYFLPPPVVPVVLVSVSEYFLALVGGPPSFSAFAFVFWGPLSGILTVLYESISLLIVSLMLPVLLCISLVGPSQGND